MSSVYSVKCLLPYFQNRVAEIKDNMDQIQKVCEVQGVFYVESSLNPSDISTRATATVQELGPDSMHQTGPYFFSLPRSEWPVTQSYSSDDIPISEFKLRDKLVYTAAARTTFCYSGLYPANSWTVVENLLNYSNSLTKVKKNLG